MKLPQNATNASFFPPARAETALARGQGKKRLDLLRWAQPLRLLQVSRAHGNQNRSPGDALLGNKGVGGCAANLGELRATQVNGACV